MNVLFLAHSFPRYATDPVGSFVLRLAVALRDLGINVQVIAPAAHDLPSRELFEGILVERFNYAPRRWQTLAYAGTMRDQVQASWSARLALSMMLAANVRRTVSAARRFHAQVIHAHWWFPAGLVAVASRVFTRLPVVTTLHGSDLRLAQEHPLPRALARRVLRRSARVTTVSRWLAQGTAALAPGVEPVVAPMPVVTELFQPGGTRERDRLLFVGKLNEQKGITYLLHALALMKHQSTLDIVVGVGSDETQCRALVDSLGLSPRIRWHPLLAQGELGRLYRSVTALVVPSIDEGLGLVAVEALLTETPVVAFDSGGLPDVVIPGETGILVPPRRPELLADALDELLSRPDQGASLGKIGRQHALATFSPAATALRYRDVYAAALD
ncbi:MAG: glycosyltransferase [Gemmatimonadetes bacterium]|nr:glycosyltransferase [Gemmatimonadota bacterium]